MTGVENIWLEEKTEDTQQRGPTGSDSSHPADAQISAGLSPDDLKKHLWVLEELSARGPTAETYCEPCKPSSDGPRNTTWHSPRTTPLIARFAPL